MIPYLRTSIILFLALFFGWFGYRNYLYFFSETVPNFKIHGIENEGYYGQDIKCIIEGSDDYKVSNISIYLDDLPLISNFKISRKRFDYNFNIPVDTLDNGEHKLRVNIESGAYSKAKNNKEIKFYVDTLPIQLAFIKNSSDNNVYQGRTVHIKFKVNKEIKGAIATCLSSKYDCFPESHKSLIYECYIPTDCELVSGEYPIIVEVSDKIGNKLTSETKFKSLSFPFKKQVIKIAPEKIKEANDSGLSEKQFESVVEELTFKSPKEKLWKGSFITPIEIKDRNQITTEFGVIRATQERGLRQHKALDLYTTPKSVVWASQDGVVVLKDTFAHSGNTIAVDHGYGLISLYFHLDSFADINVGDKVKKGNPLGKLGKTGYATGYHLHWELRLSNVPVDPMEWTKSNF